MSTGETRYAAPEKLRLLYLPLAEWALKNGEIEQDPRHKVIGGYEGTLIVEDYPPIVSSALDPGAIKRHAWEFTDRFEVGDELTVGYVLPHPHYIGNGPLLVNSDGSPEFFEDASLMLTINKHLASPLRRESLYIREVRGSFDIDRLVEERIPNSRGVKHYNTLGIPQGKAGSITLREFVGLVALADAVQLLPPQLLKLTAT